MVSSKVIRQCFVLFLATLPCVHSFVGTRIPTRSAVSPWVSAPRQACPASLRMCLPSTTEPPKLADKAVEAPKTRRTRSSVSAENALFTPKNLAVVAAALAGAGLLGFSGGDDSFFSHMAEMYGGSADVQFSKSLLGAFVIGSMSAIIAEAIAFPFDTLKTRLQLEQTKPKDLQLSDGPPLTVCTTAQ
jgi:hypothetical protein